MSSNTDQNQNLSSTAAASEHTKKSLHEGEHGEQHTARQKPDHERKCLSILIRMKKKGTNFIFRFFIQNEV